MRGEKPERPLWRVLAVLTGLAAGSSAAGFWVAHNVHRAEQERRDVFWTELMASQAGSASEALLGNVQAIKRQLFTLQGAQSGVAVPEGGVVHWAEIEWVNGVPGIRRSGRNPGYDNEFPDLMERSYLSGALRKIASKKFENSEQVEVFRYRKDPLQPTEWLLMTFGAGSEGASRALLALVDPVEAFTAFRISEEGRKNSRFRTYLLANDGRVLTHSHPPYVGADFGPTEVFREVSRAGKGNASSAGVLSSATSLDQQKVRVAFWKSTELPVIGVVERVIEEESGMAWRHIAGASLIALGGIVSLIALGTFVLSWKRRKTK